MNTRLIKYIIAFVLTSMTLPIMAQDYMNIYFKNGDSRKFYMKNITDIAASKVDANGVEHEDYNFQQITTIYDKYIYKLEDVDSITFTKIDERLAEQNFVSAMPKVFSVIENCETIMDVEEKIDQIKNADGVADAWSDGHILYVSIDNGETFSFYFNHNIEPEEEDFIENEVTQARVILSDMANTIKAKDSSLKVLIADQQYKDRNRDWSKYFNPLINDFEKCGIKPKLLNGPTVDFFYDNSENPEDPHFFDYDIILLSTHGAYSPRNQYINGKISRTRSLHGFVTSNEIFVVNKEPQDGWWEDRYNDFKYWRDYSAFKDATDEQINFACVKEGRKGVWGFKESFWVFYPELTESFFHDIAIGKFHNPKSIFFNAACQSLKGESNKPSFSLAEELFSHELGVYIGYTESNYFGQRTGANLLTHMLLNHSLDKSYQELPNYQIEETIENIKQSDLSWKERAIEKLSLRVNGEEKARLVIWPNQKYEKETTNLFLFPTITKKIDEKKALQSFNYSNTVEINGYATTASSRPDDISMGFLYSLDEDMTTSINISNVEVYVLSTPISEGNIFYRAYLTDLIPGNTYHYCAYTYDGQNYNYGDTYSFTLYHNLQVSVKKLELEKDKKVSFTINSGNGDYAIEIDKEDVVTAIIDGNTVVVEAISTGDAIIIVTDNKTGQTSSIAVTVNEPTPVYDDLVLSTYGPFELDVNAGITFSILSGSGSYVVESSNEAVATVKLRDKYIDVSGVAPDNATITITDTKTKQTASITITVKDPTPIYDNLVLSTYDPIKMNVRAGVTFSIVSGSGSYAVESSNKTVATVLLRDNYVDVSGLLPGNATITVTDTKSGQTAILNVTITDNTIPAEAVDLGLPSGTKWASYNVGATKPEEFGGYYAWGETEEKSEYSTETYKHCDALCDGNVAKWHDIGGCISGTDYDVAHVKWGDKWQMPTQRQFDELKANCTNEITTYEGVKVAKFTGPNGNYIYLPAAGQRSGSETVGENEFGDYFSGNNYLYDSSFAYPFSFDDDRYTVGKRWLGNSVRPVYVEKTTHFCPDDHHPHLIDLGLPSGILWSCSNVGSPVPHEVGCYYAWAETSPMWYDASGSYSMDNSHSAMGHTWDMTKYCTNEKYGKVDNKISLDLNDDVAHVILKGLYRMPTREEFNELINNCKSEWTTINGVNGRKFNGPNGNSIFIPSTGLWMYGELRYVEECGNYWSRSLNTELPHMASILNIYDESYFGVGKTVDVSSEERYKCKPVRAVMLPSDGSTSDLADFCLSGNLTTQITTGEKCQLSIVSGNGQYSAVSKPQGIVNISYTNNSIEIVGKKPGTTSICITDKMSGQDIFVKVTVTPKTETPAEAVDLGLPSGTKWASYNLGATKPENAGGYYSWGELEKKNSFTWNTYLYCDGDEGSCYELPNVISGTEYDIAKMKWGDAWQIPTTTQFDEFSDNCSFEWVTKNGTKGCLVTGSNGNSIFFPASGMYGESNVDFNTYGYYWASNLFNNPGYSYGAILGEDGYTSTLYYRCVGFSIRPVTK